jgi:hypothetical protein
MNVKWKLIPDIDKYVKDTLQQEAEDIPEVLINAGAWYLDEIEINEISVDNDMLQEHDQNPLHISRRDNFVDMINKGEEILPLIVLRNDLFLVDGYSRYRALKRLGISRIQVLRQGFS